MNILFIASEATPLVKVGGLADVVGALPGALKQLGHETRILLPFYGTILDAPLNKKNILELDIPWQGKNIAIRVYESVLPENTTPLYLVDAPTMFGEGGVYYEHDTVSGTRRAMERFVFFSVAATQIIEKLPWKPEIVHCHDWHTGLIPALLKNSGSTLPTILTIHNMEGQGKWHAEEALSWIGIRDSGSPALQYRDLENNFNLLQLGIRNATAVNTVSPTYAKEITNPQYGVGLERDITSRANGVSGILNGIDTDHFNPATDSRIVAQYDAQTASTGKLLNRRALLKELELPENHGPLFGVVGRLTTQKGVDIITAAVPEIVLGNGQLIVLGSGVPETEKALVEAMKPFSTATRAIVKFDAKLAQRIYAASDFFLMPSRFEPCGLGQMIAMRYGSLPLVRDTGGLHDTVTDLRDHQDGTGFVFTNPIIDEFRPIIDAALRLYEKHDTLAAARTRAMSQDFSWQHSATEYVKLYTNALAKR